MIISTGGRHEANIGRKCSHTANLREIHRLSYNQQQFGHNIFKNNGCLALAFN